MAVNLYCIRPLAVYEQAATSVLGEASSGLAWMVSMSLRIVAYNPACHMHNILHGIKGDGGGG